MLHFRLMTASLAKRLSTKFLLLVIAFAVTPTILHAQTETDGPVTVIETENGFQIEWSLPDSIPDASDPLSAFETAGWEIDQLDHILTPGYTISVIDISLEDGNANIAPEEIIASIDIAEEVAWNIPIGKKELPDLVGPDGQLRPYVGPAESAEELVSDRPVYLLRKGLQRGQRTFIIAISPIYRNGENLRLVTSGMANVIGVKRGRISLNQPASDISILGSENPQDDAQDEESEAASNQTGIGWQDRAPLESPLRLPETSPANKLANIPLQSPLGLPTEATAASGNPNEEAEKNRPSQVPLQLPLQRPAQLPTEQQQSTPLESPLRLPTAGSADAEQGLPNPEATEAPSQEGESQQRLVSPLILPTARQPQQVPLKSPLLIPTPQEPTAVPTTVPTPTAEETLRVEASAIPSPDVLAETDTSLTEPDSDINVQVPDSSGSQPSVATASQLPIMPWTGLLTFALFGLALLAVLFSPVD